MKAAHWCLGHGGTGHVFEGKLYFMRDIADETFVLKNSKPKPIPKTAAKPAPKPAPKGKRAQLCKMRQKVGRASILQHLMPLTAN